MSYTQIDPGDVSHYDEIRITRVTGEKEHLWNPHTAADTLVGIRTSGDTLRMSLAWVQEISVGQTDGAKTAGLIVGIVVVVVGVSAAVIAVTMADFSVLGSN